MCILLALLSTFFIIVITQDVKIKLLWNCNRKFVRCKGKSYVRKSSILYLGIKYFPVKNQKADGKVMQAKGKAPSLIGFLILRIEKLFRLLLLFPFFKILLNFWLSYLIRTVLI